MQFLELTNPLQHCMCIVQARGFALCEYLVRSHAFPSNGHTTTSKQSCIHLLSPYSDIVREGKASSFIMFNVSSFLPLAGFFRASQSTTPLVGGSENPPPDGGTAASLELLKAPPPPSPNLPHPTFGTLSGRSRRFRWCLWTDGRR